MADEAWMGVIVLLPDLLIHGSYRDGWEGPGDMLWFIASMATAESL